MSVPTATERKAARAAAVAAMPPVDPEAVAAAREAALAAHCRRAIDSWLKSTDAGREATRRDSITVATAGGVGPAIRDAWAAELAALGYVVTNGADRFTVALPP